MLKKILLIRHCDIDDSYKQKYIGITDIPLSNKGLENAKNISFQNRNMYHQIITSPLKRAYETAYQIKNYNNTKLNTEELLTEINFGDWEGLSFEEINKNEKNKKLIDDWSKYRKDFSFPNGESLEVFHSRIKQLAERIKDSPDNLIIVSHKGVISTLICYLLGFTLDHSIYFNLKYGDHLTIEM